MRILALSDFHLSFTNEPNFYDLSGDVISKPMDIFGDNWDDHISRIYQNWQDMVREDDIVLVPGDISWAMTLAEAKYDLQFIAKLRGRIIIIAGNHDYWWQSLAKVRAAMPENVTVIQNNAVNLPGVSIVGSRLWNVPGFCEFKESDLKIYKRELLRLEFSMNDALAGNYLIAMSHFMPVNDKHQYNEVIEMAEKYNVKEWVYGHLHSFGHQIRLDESMWGIKFHLVSGDYLGFMPKILLEI